MYVPLVTNQGQGQACANIRVVRRRDSEYAECGWCFVSLLLLNDARGCAETPLIMSCRVNPEPSSNVWNAVVCAPP